MADWKKTLLASGLVGGLIFGGVAGCGDGEDQDNGVSDGEQQDELDEDTEENVDVEENEE